MTITATERNHTLVLVATGTASVSQLKHLINIGYQHSFQPTKEVQKMYEEINNTGVQPEG